MASVTISETFLESHRALVEAEDELRQRIDDRFAGVAIVSRQATGLQNLEVTVASPDLDVLDALCHLAVEVGDRHEVTVIIVPSWAGEPAANQDANGPACFVGR